MSTSLRSQRTRDIPTFPSSSSSIHSFHSFPQNSRGSIDFLSSPSYQPTTTSPNSCQILPNVTNCDACFQAMNTTWCSSSSSSYSNYHGSCIYSTISPNVNCSTLLCPTGNLYLNNGYCSASSANVLSLVAAFVLLVICPLCALGACTYVIIMKFFGIHKVGPAGEGEEDGRGRNAYSVMPITASAEIVRIENGSQRNNHPTLPEDDPVIVTNDFIQPIQQDDDNALAATVVLTSEVKMIASSTTFTNYPTGPSIYGYNNALNAPAVQYVEAVNENQATTTTTTGTRRGMFSMNRNNDTR